MKSYTIPTFPYLCPNGLTGLCHVEVFESLNLAIVTEIGVNSGMNITNACEAVAQAVVESFYLDPVTYLQLEHYDYESYTKPGDEDTFAWVSLGWNSQQGHMQRSHFFAPAWWSVPPWAVAAFRARPLVYREVEVLGPGVSRCQGAFSGFQHVQPALPAPAAATHWVR